jgi:tRNA (guanine-N7-)-methyltransferase
MTVEYPRTIKSFVKREGRLTKSQLNALDNLWPKFGIDYSEQQLNLESIFGRNVERVLEIGFGNGDSLWQMAQASPEKDFIGIEVHRPGVGHLLHLIETSGITNLRIISYDALDVLNHQITDHSLDRLQLFFPDPWHKKKHHKRRIVQDDFANLVSKKLKTGGIFHLATDWENYAEHMIKVLNRNNNFKNLSDNNAFVSKPLERPTTKFEKRGQKLGHGVWDMLFQNQT